VFLAIHVASVVIDGFAPIGWLAAFIPFASPYRPIWLGLGAVVTDLLLAVAISSGLRRRISYRTWHLIHLSAYLCWPIAAAHALGSGTDAAKPWLLAVLVASGATLLFLLAWRVVRGPALSLRTRSLAIGGALLSPLLLMAWAVSGPLQPGWAHRAGTPKAILDRVAATTTTAGSATGGTATTSGAATGSATSTGAFSASFSGSITQSGGTVQATAPLGGGTNGSLSLLLRGQQLASGGVELRDGQVTVTLSTGAHLSGPVTSLNGNRIGATVTDAAGHRYTVSVDLTIPGDGTVQGQLSVQPTAGTASRNNREEGDGG
jgi:sulfoxide reductase heme-binding subunit YedZ